ncbi:MAG: transcription termination/antitermination protein NusA [Clostridiales bacterium]|nr:transcription termination/antitermination protein NusA [Clostridiales bacterium]
MNQDFFLALEDLEREKGISQAEFIAALENALVIAYKKSTGTAGGVEVRLNPEKKSIKIYSTRAVVEEVIDPEKEISVEEAQTIKKSYKAGDTINTEIISKNFGRIAAQTAKQILMQKLREIERDNTVSEFEDKEGELMACTVRRIEDGNVFVELGGNQIEGVLMPKDQVPGEKYELNQRLNVYVKRVKNSGKMAQIVVSRTATGLVKRLFENEVPEIKQGIVLVKGIARDAGQRTKIAIVSEDPMVDAVGACVGNKGARVNAIVAELGGEKIDIIQWSENPLEYISRALSPARVLKVVQTGDESAMAIVPDDKLSLAIGRSGQNARLAVRLTGWKIDVKSESAVGAELTADINTEEDVVEE